MSRFIFITGGVVSSLGKGLAAAALGAILQSRQWKVKIRKLDPYLNVDPGTMSPYQHGEVYVTDDGTEADLDLGHYERFTGIPSTRTDSITTGRIYASVLDKERSGDYLGATVQVVPHIIDEIKAFIVNDTNTTDFVICEIGGTVGDIESLPFLEAIRQLGNDLGREKTLFIHVTLLPYIMAAGELKTKPTQHSVKELLSLGIQPDILLCRSEYPLSSETKEKLGLFCNVKPTRVIEANDLSNIYEAPLAYHQKGLDTVVCDYFKLDPSMPDLSAWERVINRIQTPEKNVTISIVGKYVELKDAYKSLTESLIHAGIAHKAKVHINWVDSKDTKEIHTALANTGGIIVPGGFGQKGVEGKIQAIQYAREKNIPFLGICFGMQLAVIEVCRNVLHIKDASSTEFPSSCTPVVGLITEWLDSDNLSKRQADFHKLGGTMRLGRYDCHLEQGSKVYEIYKASVIQERHRHRYEVNMTYQAQLEQAGLYIVGFSPDKTLPEVVERRDHPWFIAVQFHPEFKSRPLAPHPLFTSFIKASIQQGDA